MNKINGVKRGNSALIIIRAFFMCVLFKRHMGVAHGNRD